MKKANKNPEGKAQTLEEVYKELKVPLKNF
jgi:hypothetical protein